jgi:hypothetical protein
MTGHGPGLPSSDDELTRYAMSENVRGWWDAETELIAQLGA